MSALLKIKQAGFEILINDTGGLEVKPSSKLTQAQREFLKSNKEQIIDEIKNAGIEWIECDESDPDNPLTVTCYTPNGHPILVLAQDDAHKVLLLRMNPSPA